MLSTPCKKYFPVIVILSGTLLIFPQVCACMCVLVHSYMPHIRHFAPPELESLSLHSLFSHLPHLFFFSTSHFPSSTPRISPSSRSPRWLLSDQCLWSHGPYQELPGGAGSQGTELWGQEHPPPVAQTAHRPAHCALCGRLPGITPDLNPTWPPGSESTLSRFQQIQASLLASEECMKNAGFWPWVFLWYPLGLYWKLTPQKALFNHFGSVVGIGIGLELNSYLRTQVLKC